MATKNQARPLDPGDGAVFLTAIVAAAKRPAAWGTTALGVAAMGLFAATPVYRFVDSKLEDRYASGEQRFNLSENFWTDHASEIEVVQSQIATTAGFLALAAFLLFGGQPTDEDKSRVEQLINEARDSASKAAWVVPPSLVPKDAPAFMAASRSWAEPSPAA